MAGSNRKKPTRTEVNIRIPVPTEDRVHLGRVVLVAAIGFAVGIAWPGLAQLRLAPVPPAEGTREVAATPSASAPAAAASPPAQPEPAPEPAVSEVTVDQPQVTSCTDASGKKHETCDSPAFGEPIESLLRGLRGCGGATNVAGMLSLGFDVDFQTSSFSRVGSGNSTTLPTAAQKELVACATAALSGTKVPDVPHQYQQYRVYYRVRFSTKAAPADSDAPAPEAVGASGRATVVWEVALIRKAPKDGELAARILGGTRVMVTGRQGDWYRVKYDAEGNEGWVFRSAIGL